MSRFFLPLFLGSLSVRILLWVVCINKGYLDTRTHFTGIIQSSCSHSKNIHSVRRIFHLNDLSHRYHHQYASSSSSSKYFERTLHKAHDFQMLNSRYTKSVYTQLPNQIIARREAVIIFCRHGGAYILFLNDARGGGCGLVDGVVGTGVRHFRTVACAFQRTIRLGHAHKTHF